jgi:protein-S-isoprenylcysteine O-methyltransferase Ste14
MSVTNRFDDRLEPVGVAVGVLLVLIGLGTIAGFPWVTKGDMLASAMQVVGALAMAAIGVGLVWLSRLD